MATPTTTYGAVGECPFCTTVAKSKPGLRDHIATVHAQEIVSVLLTQAQKWRNKPKKG